MNQQDEIELRKIGVDLNLRDLVFIRMALEAHSEHLSEIYSGETFSNFKLTQMRIASALIAWDTTWKKSTTLEIKNKNDTELGKNLMGLLDKYLDFIITEFNKNRGPYFRPYTRDDLKTNLDFQKSITLRTNIINFLGYLKLTENDNEK